MGIAYFLLLLVRISMIDILHVVALRVNDFDMTYELYRNTTLGHTLQEALDELVGSGQISQSLAFKVLQQYDKSVSDAFATRIKGRVAFTAGRLMTYRYCDCVWTLVLKDVEFQEIHNMANVDKVKIVACETKR